MSDYSHLQEGLIPIKAEYSKETMNESKKTPNQICAANIIKFSLLLLTLSGLVGEAHCKHSLTVQYTVVVLSIVSFNIS